MYFKKIDDAPRKDLPTCLHARNVTVSTVYTLKKQNAHADSKEVVGPSIQRKPERDVSSLAMKQSLHGHK